MAYLRLKLFNHSINPIGHKKPVQTRTIRRGALRFATQISPLLNFIYSEVLQKIEAISYLRKLKTFC